MRDVSDERWVEVRRGFFFSLSYFSFPFSPSTSRLKIKNVFSLFSLFSLRTDVGAYHRDGNFPETSAKLSELSGQFSLMVRWKLEGFFLVFMVEVTQIV